MWLGGRPQERHHPSRRKASRTSVLIRLADEGTPCTGPWEVIGDTWMDPRQRKEEGKERWMGEAERERERDRHRWIDR